MLQFPTFKMDMDKKHNVIKLPGSESVINCSAYCEGVRVGSIEIDQISEVLKQPDRFVWIGLREPDTEMLRMIQKQFDLHELAIEDAHSAHQRPKIESYGESLFIVLRTAHMKDQRIEMGETHFFLGKNFIVTIRHGSSLSYSDVRQRCESSPNLLRKGPGFALYAVMDSIVDHYFPVIDELERELSNLEAKVFREKFRRETTAKIYRLKRQVLEMKRIVSPMIDICNRLMRFDLKMIDDDTKPYFRDVYDHTIRINEMIDNTRELLSAALEANLSMLSISQSEISKSFAGWAALIGIPTMVAGIYGMNFKYMPELDWKYGYPAVMTVTVGLCVALYLRFKKSGWL